MGTHGRRGLDRVLIGSDAEQVARLAPVPVLLVRQSHPATANPPALREQ
ncbi:universal stress protein [Pseudomonas aeruginosa]